MENRPKFAVFTWVFLLIAIMLSVVLLILIIDESNDVSFTGQNNSEIIEVTRDTDRLSRIVNNPEAFYGKRYIIEGEIQDVYNSRTFTISDQTIGDELLVVTRNPLSDRQADEGEEFFEDNADVRLIGEVRELVVAEIEREIDFNFDQSTEAEFERRPVMIVELLEFSDEDALFDFNQGVLEDK